MMANILPFASCNWRCGACTANFVMGVNVRVIDAATGAAIGGATLTLADGDYTEILTESLSSSISGSYYGAGERPGTYTLTVQAAGYQDATLEDIVVVTDECGCHVIPVERTVEMTPS
jgi:uncharacterized surface anchored protein